MVRKALNNPVLERHLAGIAPDGVTWFALGRTSQAFQMRGILIHGTHAICQMRANHQLNPIETKILGQALLGSGLSAALQKEPGTVMLRIDSTGCAEGMSAEGMKLDNSTIHARSRIFHDHLPEAVYALDSTDKIFLPGSMTLTRIEKNGRPVSGSVSLKTGNIAKDLAYYYLESEQIRTAVDIGLHFTPEGLAFGAGALLLQAMPGSDDRFIEQVETMLSGLPPLGLWFSQGGTRDNLLMSIFKEAGFVRTAEGAFAFDCPCSWEKFLEHIISLDTATVDDIIANGPWPLKTTCHYCSSQYEYSKEAVESARKKIRSRS